MSLAALLLERQRRQQAAVASAEAEEAAVAAAAAAENETAAEVERRRARYEAVAAELRSWFGDKQREFFARAPRARKATLKTRRSGATSGGVRECIARALEQPGFRARYVNEIREEAKGLAWRADTQQGFCDVLDRLAEAGHLYIAEDRRGFARGADVLINESTLTIDFRNGSQIRFFCADDVKSQERGRGGAPHLLWVDEAQKYPNLENFIESIFGPSMVETDGETWLTGTPSELCAGYFYDVTRDDEPELRAPGWSVLDWSVLDNPFFGATREERFDRVIRTVILGKKPITWADTDDAWVEQFLADPPAWFEREWLARWVKSDALFVYSVHRWPAPVTFAPLRTTPLVPPWLRLVNPEGCDPSGVSGFTDRWYDHAASVRDLPRVLPGTDTRVDWFYALGVDFGYRPDPFAVKLWAWSPQLPGIWSMWSWKRTLVLPDYQREAVLWFLRNVPGLVYLDGDPGGLQGAHLEGWRELLNIPIDDAEKSAKRTWIELFNNDGELGRIRMREGEVHLHEMRHLTWTVKRGKLAESDNRVLPDKTIPGRDGCDAGLYSYRRLVSRNRDEPVPPPKHGSPEWWAEEERRTHEAAVEAGRLAHAEEAALAGEVEGWGWE